MRDHLGVGLRAEIGALFLQLLAQLAKVLDDAVVDDGETIGGMGVRVGFGGAAVSRPTGVPDTDRASERLAGKAGFEIAQLALGTAPRELPALQRGHAGG